MEKSAYKTAKKPPVKKKKRKKERKKERKDDRERVVDFGEKPIMLRWPYLQNPPLDHAVFQICCSYYTPLLNYRRVWKEHNPFDKNHHRKFPGKQKGNAPAGQFGCRPISTSFTVGSCSFLDTWCAQMLPSFWTVEIGKSFSDKVSCMLNISSSIFR